MREIIKCLKENLKGYSETEINNIAKLIEHDFIIADQYEECVGEDEFDIDLFHKNYKIYTDQEEFIADWFDGEVLSNEQLINRIENYGAALSASYNHDMTVFIVDKR